MFYAKSEENIILIIYATLRVPNEVRRLLFKIISKLCCLIRFLCLSLHRDKWGKKHIDNIRHPKSAERSEAPAL